MVKRKSTQILEALSAPPKVEEPIVEIKVDEPAKETVIVAESPIVYSAPPVVPDAPKKKPRAEKDPYAEELKKIRKFQEDQQNRLEARLEGMIARKFMEVKNMSQPVRNYKPQQPPPIQRVKFTRSSPTYYTPDEDEEDNFTGYATQEEDMEEEPKKSELFCKIFG